MLLLCYICDQINGWKFIRTSPLPVNITVHNSVLLNSNTAYCAFILHCVVYFLKTTKLSCECYCVGLLWHSTFWQTFIFHHKSVLSRKFIAHEKNVIHTNKYFTLKFKHNNNWKQFKYISIAVYTQKYISKHLYKKINLYL